MEFFRSINFKLLGLCVVLLVVGYVLLAQGPADNPLSRTVAPVFLVVTYCVLIPFSVVAGSRTRDKANSKGV